MVAEFLNGVFNLDSKVFKTFKYLLFKPGKLSLQYVQGIRKTLMKPIQLFLVSNILFFLLLTQADILRVPAKYYFNGNNVPQAELQQLEAQSGLDQATLHQRYNALSTDTSKAAVFLIIPISAFMFWLLNYKKQKYFGEHLVFAMHHFSFFLIFCVLLILISWMGNKLIQLSIVSINVLYLAIATRVFYKDKLSTSVIKGLLGTTLFILITLAYRQCISDFSFYLLNYKL